jgi:hypothetical protein
MWGVCHFLGYDEDPNAAGPQPNRSISRKGAKGAKVTGLGSSSRANARDLRKISPFGRNDTRVLGVLAREK